MIHYLDQNNVGVVNFSKAQEPASPTHLLRNNPQINLFLIKGKDVKKMLETSMGYMQLSGLRVTYRVNDTNYGNRIKECYKN